MFYRKWLKVILKSHCTKSLYKVHLWIIPGKRPGPYGRGLRDIDIFINIYFLWWNDYFLSWMINFNSCTSLHFKIGLWLIADNHPVEIDTPRQNSVKTPLRTFISDSFLDDMSHYPFKMKTSLDWISYQIFTFTSFELLAPIQ